MTAIVQHNVVLLAIHLYLIHISLYFIEGGLSHNTRNWGMYLCLDFSIIISNGFPPFTHQEMVTIMLPVSYVHLKPKSHSLGRTFFSIITRYQYCLITLIWASTGFLFGRLNEVMWHKILYTLDISINSVFQPTWFCAPSNVNILGALNLLRKLRNTFHTDVPLSAFI